MIRNIEDPEHPLSLEQLRVVSLEQIKVDASRREVEVRFTPTIPHCSSASIIGLMIRTKLSRGLPENYKVRLASRRSPSRSPKALTTQTPKFRSSWPVARFETDKERVSAALENRNISKQINKRIKDTDDVSVYLK